MFLKVDGLDHKSIFRNRTKEIDLLRRNKRSLSTYFGNHGQSALLSSAPGGALRKARQEARDNVRARSGCWSRRMRRDNSGDLRLGWCQHVGDAGRRPASNITEKLQEDRKSGVAGVAEYASKDLIRKSRTSSSREKPVLAWPKGLTDVGTSVCISHGVRNAGCS